MNKQLQSAIINAVQSGWKLNEALANVFSNTTQKQCELIIFEAAQLVCDTYNAHPKCATVLGFKASKRGGAPTIGDLMDDGSINTSKRTDNGCSNAAQTANRWFQRNIIGAGIIKTNPTQKEYKDVVAQRAKWFSKLDAADARRFLKLIGA